MVCLPTGGADPARCARPAGRARADRPDRHGGHSRSPGRCGALILRSTSTEFPGEVQGLGVVLAGPPKICGDSGGLSRSPVSSNNLGPIYRRYSSRGCLGQGRGICSGRSCRMPADLGRPYRQLTPHGGEFRGHLWVTRMGMGRCATHRLPVNASRLPVHMRCRVHQGRFLLPRLSWRPTQVLRMASLARRRSARHRP